jgi:hypothetical protein
MTTTGTHVDLGQAMIVMIEPDRDPERLAEYNRWYEHDHVYSGVVAGPGAFSYSRFVATRELKDLRYPDASAIAEPTGKGSYLSFFYLLAGQVDEHYVWSFPESKRLGEEGRMNADRELVSLSLYDFAGSVNREGWPVPAEISLDHRYPAVVAMWIDRAATASLGDLTSWLLETKLPAVLQNKESGIAQALVFSSRDFPGLPGTGTAVGDRVLVAFFLDVDPREVWSTSFGDLGDAVAGSGLGSVVLAAPFIGTIPGTSTYSDQLW